MFWSAGKILERLREVAGLGMIPFADDTWGDFYWLDLRKAGAEAVLQDVEGANEPTAVAASFAEFRACLRSRDEVK